MPKAAELTIWTIGHSTRELAEFIELLEVNGVRALADVRRYPGSRKYPHFNSEALAHALRAGGIGYEHHEHLGGRRRPLADSGNTVWRNESFRGYADYMGTGQFTAAVGRLVDLARRLPTAIMCSEAVWWRCHRALVSDHLKSSGIRVEHIISPGKNEFHPYTSAARIVDGKLFYGPADRS